MEHFMFVNFILLIFHAYTVYSQQQNTPLYCARFTKLAIGYKCVENNCEKTITSPDGDNSTCLTSLAICKLICDGSKSVWPAPTGLFEISDLLVPVAGNDDYSVCFSYNAPFTRSNTEKLGTLQKLTKSLEQKLVNHLAKKGKCRSGNDSNGGKLQITFNIESDVVSFNTDTDESYAIRVSTENSTVTVSITGKTYFGTRHGLETLLQLIVYDANSNIFFIPESVSIEDKPAFRYRALMLDTSRNYFPINSIKKILDGMALNKMNTFHWHLTDSQSFPYASDAHPEMAVLGAYSMEQIYTMIDVREIVEYARKHGIRVVPEFDTPAHVGEGWQNFIDEKTGLSYLTCFKASPWAQYCGEPPCGQFNPTVEGVYEVLGDLYKEYFAIFDSDLFHMGGDEVTFICWNNSQINTWINESTVIPDKDKDDYHYLWYYFQDKATEKLEKVNGGSQRIVLWTSSLTKHADFESQISPSKHIIQIWEETTSYHISDLLKMRYNVIFSVYDELYLDCGFSNWITSGLNWCSPYIEWQKVYMHNPYTIVKNLGIEVNDTIKNLILGSEAALWTEQADSANADSRIWPRTAALAERLWSNPKTNWQAAKSRISYQRERLVSLGINADRLDPTWCLENDGKCNAKL